MFQAHTGKSDPDSLGNGEADRLATSATQLAIEQKKTIVKKTKSKT